MGTRSEKRMVTKIAGVRMKPSGGGDAPCAVDRATECGAIVEPDPALAQIVGLLYGPPIEHRPRIAHRHDIVLPPLSQRLDSGDHLFGGEGWPGHKPAMLPLPGGEYLDVRSADIDNQHLHGRFSRASSAM